MSLLIFWLLLLLFIALGLPVAFALAVAALGLSVAISEGLSFSTLSVVMAQRMFGGADSFPILALPLFFLAGAFMEAGGISDRLLRFAQIVVGWVRGGLSMVVVLAEMFFAGITGSSSADAAAIGSVMIPAMRRRGYSPQYAAALVAAGGSIGPVIPPSIGLVVYGSMADVSIARLFVGGVVPGLLLACGLLTMCAIFAIIRDYPREDLPSLLDIAKATLGAIIPLGAPVIILGGIFTGVFTATESAMVAVAYGFIVSKFVYRTITWRQAGEICYDTAVNSSRVMFIIAVASFVGWILARELVPQQLGVLLLSLSENPLVILLIINVMLLVFGCFLETLALMIILLPTILPIIKGLGIDPVFFGVMLIVNLAIGSITPPVGVCLMVSASIAKVPFEQTLGDLLPFLAVLIAVLGIIMLFPQTVLWLPGLVF
jgi:C4-dicarboxylate transporter, DctM subunit